MSRKRPMFARLRNALSVLTINPVEYHTVTVEWLPTEPAQYAPTVDVVYALDAEDITGRAVYVALGSPTRMRQLAQALVDCANRVDPPEAT